MPDPSSSAALPPPFQRAFERTRKRDQDRARESLEALVALDISSYERLAEALPTLRDGALTTAVWAMPYLDKRRTVPMLHKLLRSEAPESRGYALLGLEKLHVRGSTLLFIHHLREDPDPWVREGAAHGLGFRFFRPVESEAVNALMSALQDEAEHPLVRAQAAESLGNIFDGEERGDRGWQAAEDALIHALDHPAPELRFWSAFSLGKMRSEAALPRLRHLAETDSEICPLWWAVKDEAADAIECIQTGCWPEHERVMHR